jgi:hypothetical protein
MCRDVQLCVWLVAICIVVLAPGSGTTAERLVDLELVLAADISGSMDLKEAALQRRGFAHALRHPHVIEAIRRGRFGRIAVTYVEWAGNHHQNKLVGWTEIADESSAAAFAKTLKGLEVDIRSWTSISTVIAFAARSFHGNGYHGERLVIDISGDGPNNGGADVISAQNRAVAKGITIDGLPIINDRPGMEGYPPMPNLDLYNEDCVIGGAGAFMVVANGFEDFARAVLRQNNAGDRRPDLTGQAIAPRRGRFPSIVQRGGTATEEMAARSVGRLLMKPP